VSAIFQILLQLLDFAEHVGGNQWHPPLLLGPVKSAGDVQYAETLAGRVALALDNATLSAELSSTERRLEVILGSVDAAVTVRDRNGRMVYANRAAADLLRLPDTAAVMAMPPGELIRRFDVYTEAGDPLELTDMLGTRLLQGEPAPAAITVRNVVKATGEERWLLYQARGVMGADGRIELAVNLIEDVTEAKRNEIAQRLLARTGRTMAEASDLASTLQAMAEAAVPGLADWAGADLLDEAGRIRPFAIAHRDPDKLRLGWRLRTEWPAGPGDAAGVAGVIRTGEPRLISDVDDGLLQRTAQDPEHLSVLRTVGLNSVMIAPISAGERVLGALSFVSSTSRRFDQRDLELACDLGRQVGIVIDSAKLHAEQLHIAHTLQAGLVPRSLPAVPGWQLSSAYRAAGRANEVGGDFYDVIVGDGSWVAIIGDVVGKGAEAAALTALARHTLAAIIESTGDVGQALAVLNRRLRHRGGDCRSLCTACAVQVAGDDTARVFSAGHPLPLLRGEAGVHVVGAPSPMLGYVDELEISETTIDLRTGSQLVLYTDGVLDAIGPLDRFGEARLLETVGRLAAGETAAADLLAALDRFADEEQADDIAILTLTRPRVPAAALLAATDHP
jgi:serine phosphatase RsbU (regulator of sigma subunit)/PAS domain-containing protein